MASPPHKRPNGGRFAATAADLGAYFDVSRRTIHDWLAKGCPPRTEWGYDVGAVFRWRLAQLAERQTSDSSLDARLELAKVRNSEADVALRQRRLEVMVNELVSSRAARAEVNAILQRLRKRLARTPGQMVRAVKVPLSDDERTELLEGLTGKIDLLLHSIDSSVRDFKALTGLSLV